MINKLVDVLQGIAILSLCLQGFTFSRQNKDLRKRLITLEDYIFGTHTEDDVWGN